MKTRTDVARARGATRTVPGRPIRSRTILQTPSPSDELPAVLTVEEAAQLLRICRSLAYLLARRYLASDGREGLPVIKIGSRLLVPRWAIEELLATGRVVHLADEIQNERTDVASATSRTDRLGVHPTAKPSRTRPRPSSPRPPPESLQVEQLKLLPSD